MEIKEYKRIFKEDGIVDTFSIDGLKQNYKNPVMDLDVFNNLDKEKIPVTKFFRYGYNYPTKLASTIDILILKLGEEAFWNLFSDIKPITIDFNNVVPTVDFISRLAVHLEYQGRLQDSEMPYFVYYMGRHFCISKHENIVNQSKFGKKVRGCCIDYEKLVGMVK